jgi:hypothetical protein
MVHDDLAVEAQLQLAPCTGSSPVAAEPGRRPPAVGEPAPDPASGLTRPSRIATGSLSSGGSGGARSASAATIANWSRSRRR